MARGPKLKVQAPRKRRFGTGSVHGHRAGFQAKWMEDGDQNTRNFTTADDAHDFLDDLFSGLRNGTHLPTRLANLTFGVVAREWACALGHVSGDTAKEYRRMATVDLIPVFGKIPIKDLTTHMVKKWATAQLDAGIPAATVKKRRAILRLICQAAIDMKCISVNPCDGIRLPRDRKKAADEMVFLTEPEVWSLVSALDFRYRMAVVLAAYAGFRAGEVWALRESSINFATGYISIERSDPVGGDSERRDATKTYASTRAVKVSEDILEGLRKHLTTFGRGPDGRMFAGPKGARVNHLNFYQRQFDQAIKDSAIPKRPRFHDLRHTCVAILFSHGASVEEARRVLGHTNKAMTEQYSHVFPEQFDRLATDIGAAVADSIGHMWDDLEVAKDHAVANLLSLKGELEA